VQEAEKTAAEEVAGDAVPTSEGLPDDPVRNPSASAVGIAALIEKGKAAFQGYVETVQSGNDRYRENYRAELDEVFAAFAEFRDNFHSQSDLLETTLLTNEQLRRERDFANENATSRMEALEVERAARAAAEQESHIASGNFLDASGRVEVLQAQQTTSERRITEFSGRAERSEDALRNMRDSRCSCGGRYALIGNEVRCETCKRHEGYGVPLHWKERASEILVEAIKDVKG
jgi:hypothetical protein